jgi:hypothetical protein
MKSMNDYFANETNNCFANANYHNDPYQESSICDLMFTNKQDDMEVHKFDIFEKTQFKPKVSLSHYICILVINCDNIISYIIYIFII